MKLFKAKTLFSLKLLYSEHSESLFGCIVALVGLSPVKSIRKVESDPCSVGQTWNLESDPTSSLSQVRARDEPDPSNFPKGGVPSFTLKQVVQMGWSTDLAFEKLSTRTRLNLTL